MKKIISILTILMLFTIILPINISAEDSIGIGNQPKEVLEKINNILKLENIEQYPIITTYGIQSGMPYALCIPEQEVEELYKQYEDFHNWKPQTVESLKNKIKKTLYCLCR